jgi:hypothetical protein
MLVIDYTKKPKSNPKKYKMASKNSRRSKEGIVLSCQIFRNTPKCKRKRRRSTRSRSLSHPLSMMLIRTLSTSSSQNEQCRPLNYQHLVPKKKVSRDYQIRHLSKKVNQVSQFRLLIPSLLAPLRVYRRVLFNQKKKPNRQIPSQKIKRSSSLNIMIFLTPQETKTIYSTTWPITASRVLRRLKTIELRRKRNWRSVLSFQKSTRKGQTASTGRETRLLKNSQK